MGKIFYGNLGQGIVNDDTFFALVNSRLDQVSPFHGAELLVDHFHAAHLTGYGYSRPAQQEISFGNLTLLIQLEERRLGSCRSAFPEIYHISLFLFGYVEDGKTATAQAAGLRLYHTQHKAGSYSGIKSIAALFEDLHACLGR